MVAVVRLAFGGPPCLPRRETGLSPGFQPWVTAFNAGRPEWAPELIPSRSGMLPARSFKWGSWCPSRANRFKNTQPRVETLSPPTPSACISVFRVPHSIAHAYPHNSNNCGLEPSYAFGVHFPYSTFRIPYPIVHAWPHSSNNCGLEPSHLRRAFPLFRIPRSMSAIPRLALTAQRIAAIGPGNSLSLLHLARSVEWSGTR